MVLVGREAQQGVGVNNSNDFPNLAPSRMWMAALERNCEVFFFGTRFCFFIGRRGGEERRRRRMALVIAVMGGRMSAAFIISSEKSVL